MEDQGNSVDELTLEDLLTDITNTLESSTPVVEVPEVVESPEVVETPNEEQIRPTIVENIKTTEEEIDDFITTEELDTLEAEMIAALEEADAETVIERSEKERIQLELDQLIASSKETSDTLEAVEALWSKIQGVPVLGKLVQDVIEGREVNIPEMVTKKVEEDIASMPNIDIGSNISIPEKPMTMQELFNSTPTVNFSK